MLTGIGVSLKNVIIEPPRSYNYELVTVIFLNLPNLFKIQHPARNYSKIQMKLISVRSDRQGRINEAYPDSCWLSTIKDNE